MVNHYQVLCYHVTGYSPQYSDSQTSAVLSSILLILTIRLFTIKFCAIVWWADPHNMLIHHQVLYYHVTNWSPLYDDSPSSPYYHVTCWSPPYGDSPSSALLSCDNLIPTIWWFTIKSVLSYDLLIPTTCWFTIKCCTITWQADPHYMVIHHQVLYVHVTGWSLQYGDSPSSAVLWHEWLIYIISWFTIKYCTIMAKNILLWKCVQ